MFERSCVVKFDGTTVEIAAAFGSAKIGEATPVLIRLPIARATAFDITCLIENAVIFLEQQWKPEDEDMRPKCRVTLVAGGDRQRVLASVLREMGYEVE